MVVAVVLQDDSMIDDTILQLIAAWEAEESESSTNGTTRREQTGGPSTSASVDKWCSCKGKSGADRREERRTESHICRNGSSPCKFEFET